MSRALAERGVGEGGATFKQWRERGDVNSAVHCVRAGTLQAAHQSLGRIVQREIAPTLAEILQQSSGQFQVW